MVTYFLPAVGLRGRDTGDIRSPDVVGRFWSSSPHTSYYAWFLRFDIANVQAGTYFTHRAWGLSVRCVQEFTEKKSGLNPSNFVL